MENQKRLELTLCNLLPYDLKYVSPKRERQHILDSSKEETIELLGAISMMAIIRNSEFGKPILHSMDKLTEPILEGGLIPIVELAKRSCPLDCTDAEFEFEYDDAKDGYWCNVEIKGRVVWCILFDTFGNFFQLVYETPKTSFQEDCNNWLKENHFNIYDLPKEMYIEKSTH